MQCNRGKTKWIRAKAPLSFSPKYVLAERAAAVPATSIHFFEILSPTTSLSLAGIRWESHGVCRIELFALLCFHSFYEIAIDFYY